MSFFTRHPNPPVPKPAVKAVQSMAAPLGPIKQAVQGVWVNAAQQSPLAPQQEAQRAQSNTRFRSFAERYIVERCRDWKEGEIDERAWAAILEAKSIYNKVREVGRTLGDDT